MAKGRGQADHAVAAHAEHADVVEKDDAGGASRIDGGDEQSADQDIRAARFVDDGRSERIVQFGESFSSLGEWAGAQIGSAGNDDAGRGKFRSLGFIFL